MATRTESVRLELIDDFTTPMARAAAATALLNDQLDRLNRTTSSQHTQAANAFARNQQSVNRSFDQGGASIDRFSGRIGLAVDGVLTLGSALVPVGALAGQAAGGLAAMGAAAAVAAASAIVAFQGVGDAIKAVQKYQDDPTADNLRAANAELAGMAPAARRFVVEWQKAQPLFDNIQQAAARGWFPGLTMALDQLDVLAPKLETILVKSGRMGGLLVKDAVTSLGGERWEEFFAFVADEVPTAEASLARIMGDLAHGAAEMWMAFDPGNDSFIGWVEDVADSFDRWASSAEGREDIADFLAYARESGPQVADFLSAVGSALVGIVQAAAPLGGPTLQILTAIAEVFADFVDSDLGTPFITGLVAMRLYTRGAALAAAAQARLNATMAGGTAGAAGRGGVPLFGTLTAAQRASMTAAQTAQRQAQQRGALARGAGAGLAGGLLATGAADSLGLSNTAMLTLMGTLAGGYMPLLGAAAGLTLDAAAANNDLAKSIEAADAAIGNGDFTAGITALADARAEQAKFAKDMDPNDWSNAVDPGFYKNTIEGWFGDNDVEEGEKALQSLERQMMNSQTAVAGLGEAFGIAIGPLDGSTRSVQELEKALASAKPAMDRLGVSQSDLTAAQLQQRLIEGDGNSFLSQVARQGDSLTPYDDLVERLNRTAQWMDTAAGRAQNYRTVLSDLATETGTAADASDRFREALDALLDPDLDAEAAFSAQIDALKEIRRLDSDAGFSQRSEAGRANLTATRDYTAAVKERLATMIGAKASEEDIAGALKQSRDQFIQSGIAAGFSAAEMRKRADEIGLTPKLVETTFTALGISKFARNVEDLDIKVRRVPPKVRTALLAEGIPRTSAQVDALARKYKLTEGEKKALVTLLDQASGKARALDAVLNRVARDRQARIDIVTYERTVQQGKRGQGPLRYDKAAADGGSVPKTGLPYADRHLYLLADGEEIISNRYGQADRFRADRASGRIPGYAEGGTTGATPTPARTGSTPGDSNLTPLARAARESARELKGLQSELKASTERLERERSERTELAGTIRSNFSTDPFAAPEGSVWGKSMTADPLGALRGDNANLREYETLVKRLRLRGLDGEALGEADTLAEAQTLAGLSKRDLGKYERLYEQRQRLAARAGGAYATGVTGVSPADIDRLAKHVQRVERAVRRAEKSNETAQEKASREVADSNRSTASRASRRRRKTAA